MPQKFGDTGKSSDLELEQVVNFYGEFEQTIKGMFNEFPEIEVKKVKTLKDFAS